MLSKKQITAYVAEFFGTAILTYVILSLSRGQLNIAYFNSIGIGITLGLLVLVLGPLSGANVNPAVTIGMWTMRKIKSLDAVLYVAAQFIGAVAALKLFEYFIGQTLPSIAGKDFNWKVLIAEAVGTLVFTFGIAAAVSRSYEGGKLAATIGMSILVGILVAGVASNGILNPAAALGARSWDKAYVIGPIIGAILGMNLYVLLFAPEGSIKALVSPKKKSATTSSKSKTKSKKKK